MVVFATVAAIDTADDDEDNVRDAIGVGDRLGVACTQCREGEKLRKLDRPVQGTCKARCWCWRPQAQELDRPGGRTRQTEDPLAPNGYTRHLQNQF